MNRIWATSSVFPPLGSASKASNCLSSSARSASVFLPSRSLDWILDTSALSSVEASVLSAATPLEADSSSDRMVSAARSLMFISRTLVHNPLSGKVGCTDAQLVHNLWTRGGEPNSLPPAQSHRI